MFASEGETASMGKRGGIEVSRLMERRADGSRLRFQKENNYGKER